MYKVTLSMPIYNVAPYVERALLSALNQTFESIEYLLVDDRGTDNSMEIVRRIIEKHPRRNDVRIIEHEHNIGTGATKNTAIANATGEYLFFMDSDDEITQDCIQTLFDAMIQQHVDIVISSYDRLDQNGNFISKKIYTNKLIIDKYCLLNKLLTYSSILCYFPMWNKLYNIELLRKKEIYCIPHHLNEDVVFTFWLLENAKSAFFIDKITLHYYLINNSTEYNRHNKLNERYLKQYSEILDIYYQALDKNKPYYNRLLSYVILYNFTIIYSIISHTNLNRKIKAKYCNLLKRKYHVEDIIKLKEQRLRSLIYYYTMKLPFNIQIKVIRYKGIYDKYKKKRK